jgi:5-methylcytosine-specific restriction endonuclease McrA
MTEAQLRQIFEKTDGHCHFCGDEIRFGERGGRSIRRKGPWEVDHVIQRAKGGLGGVENCLPASTPCNRLRWQRTGQEI